MKAHRNELTQQQRAQIRRLISPVLCGMMRKDPSGKFDPSDELCAGLEKIGGTRRDWNIEFEAMKLGRVKAAFEKIGDLSDKIDVKQIALDAIECVAENTSIWGMGQPENAACVKKLSMEHEFVVFVTEFVNAYCQSVDFSVSALVRRKSVMQRNLSSATHALHVQWDNYVKNILKDSVQSWTERFAPFPMCYEGALPLETVTALIIGALKIEIRERVHKAVCSLNAAPLVAQISNINTSPEEAETVYYIAGAIFHRMLKHVNRLISAGNKTPCVFQAKAFLDLNSLSQQEALLQKLPIGLVIERRKAKLVFVSYPFFTLVVMIEAIFGANATVENMDGHGSELFVKVEKLVLQSQDIKQAFGAAVPQPISSDDSTAASSHASGYYDMLIGIIVKNYRKIRQADFLKALYRKKCAESEALRRKLKTAKSTSETKNDWVIERETKKHAAEEKKKEKRPLQERRKIASRLKLY